MLRQASSEEGQDGGVLDTFILGGALGFHEEETAWERWDTHTQNSEKLGQEISQHLTPGGQGGLIEPRG